MKGLELLVHATPLHPLPRLGRELAIDLWIKRDDLTPVPGGGAKIRKLARILQTAPPHTDALVTTGGVQSNHARVVALVAAQKNLKCELVLHGDDHALKDPSGNLLLALLSGARVVVVPSHRVRETLDRTLGTLQENGFCPLFIEGGAHSLEGALGLAEAVLEVNQQRPDPNWVPDYIVHASGTGGTQAGILAGLDIVGWPTHVIGVSVARAAERGTLIVEELYERLRRDLQLGGKGRLVDFRDEWIGRGYAEPLPDAEKLIKMVASMEGIPLDPTYTAKAMRGMVDLVRRGDIPKGSRVLFWHTGGLLNLMSAAMDWGFDG